MVARAAAGPAGAPAPRVPAAAAAHDDGLAGSAHAHLPAQLQVCFTALAFSSEPARPQQVGASRCCCTSQRPTRVPVLQCLAAHQSCTC